MFGGSEESVFESLEKGGYVSGPRVREWVLSTKPWGVDFGNDELVGAWDAADVSKMGKLDVRGFGVFVRELDACARRRRAKAAGVAVFFRAEDEAPPPRCDETETATETETETETAAVPPSTTASSTASSTLVVLIAACLRREDGEGGVWNKKHIARSARALGLADDDEEQLSALGRLSFSRARGEDDAFLGPLLAAPLRGVAGVDALVTRSCVASHVAASAYDSRARRCAARVASALEYRRDWLARVEAAVAAAMSGGGAETKRLQHTHRDTSSSLAKYAKIGGVGLAAGAAVALTAGLAAPVVAAALATSTAFGASALVTFAGTYSVMFALTFGAAGGGLAGYRMQRRVAGVTDFEFKDDDDDGGNARGLALAIGVSGSMRDATDFATAYGLPPPPDEHNLAARTRRAIAQLFNTADADWISRRANEILTASDVPNDVRATERRVASHLFGDPSAKVDARPPPPRVLDTATANLAAAALADAVASMDEAVAASMVDQQQQQQQQGKRGTPRLVSPIDPRVLESALALRGTADKDDDDDDDDKLPTTRTNVGPEAADLVSRASALFDQAFSRAAAVAAEEEEGNDAKATDDVGASWSSRLFLLSTTPPKKKKEKREPSAKDDDVPLWWWRAEFGERTGSDMHVLVWEREMLVEVTESMESMARSLAASGAQETIILGASASAAAVVLTTLAVPIYLIRATKYIDSTWTVAVERAKAAGVALADALCDRDQIGCRPVTLVGYSLGARVVFECLDSLARRDAEFREAKEKREGASLGTLWVTALDGVHWLGRDLERARVGVRVHERSPDSMTTSKLALAGERCKAPVGAPVIWFDRTNTAAAKVPDIKFAGVPDDAVVEVVLVDDDSNFLTKSVSQLETLCTAEFQGWVLDARNHVGPAGILKLAPLYASEQRAPDSSPAATVRVELRWSADDKPPARAHREPQGYAGIVEHALLLGAPLKGPATSSAERDRWKRAAKLVSGQFVNAYSSNDLMLAIMFRSQSWASSVAGLSRANMPGYVRDLDVSSLINSHDDYHKNIKNILNLLDLDNPDLEP
ncbi:hypothetical protein CTAYLR_002891 [Chrysophaeum taylorii]|uniref:Uncharacterized protein n=1 Tax=Chrysophaeum taylorii TaxID=2483200 RepID=A0AAD7UMN8_9STRA|nr:hypothetical protein CTAYLR_002891 [Chrysophaeum taylorii]